MHDDLIRHFLKATSQNQDIYPLFLEHLDKLNNSFSLELREFARQQFLTQPTKAVDLARIIVKFSKLMQNFEQGNPAVNLEIAIAGYESALTVITRETFPQGWTSIQQTLVNAYQQRQDILSTTITELRNNTVQTQNQIKDLTEQFKQEKQQYCDLKTQFLKVMEFQEYSKSAIDLQPIVTAIKEIKSSVQQFNTVIFYDIENLTLGSSEPQFNFSLRDIIENIKRYNLVNQIAGQYAYADWSNFKLQKIKNDIQKLGIEPMQIFGFNHHKNAADIQLVIDAVELIHRKPSLEVFAIVSGDGGFSCLAKKLHEYGKVVIGCGYENQTNKVLAAVCDYFFRLPDPLQQKKISNPITTVEEPKRRNNS
ncbi:NYN domain-containing protein [Plectonema cf. radiosum LEGE 06105]|uniref:NYN domain-containing protein n=1 Tax=Plectonema cf. radiosum LEGE 06105 TaxID=945769 RepID=A0A8J7F872_9CYAN|nr:NYN domain-containing protein [Plectonema radiosum]MBE9216005.1 NYN domain-containing protein [Plectonema cf. radiosum LEGE 06105]